MPYLSRLILNPRSRQVRSELAQPYEMHRTLLRAFPSAEAGGSGRVLFRVDVPRDSGIPILLVQSELTPDWRPLGMLRDYLLEPPEFRPISPQFSVGRRLRFRLRANPTVKRDGKRLGLVREEDQLAWLWRKADAGGFAVTSALIVPEGILHGRKIDERGGHLLSHFATRFEGVLTVREPATFAQTLTAGVGTAKGLGFGLLSVPYP